LRHSVQGSVFNYSTFTNILISTKRFFRILNFFPSLFYIDARVTQETDNGDFVGHEVALVKSQTLILRAILAELKCLPAKQRDFSIDDSEVIGVSQWKLLATVVDRLCFCICTAFHLIATLITFRRQLLWFVVPVVVVSVLRSSS